MLNRIKINNERNKLENNGDATYSLVLAIPRMPHFWDFGKSPPKQRNLQDGLFQIASQTCSLLVQVNNTNNISYGNNSSNIHLNNLSSGPSRSRAPNEPTGRGEDREQLLVLIPPASERVHKFRRPSGLLGKRLSVSKCIYFIYNSSKATKPETLIGNVNNGL